MELRGAGVVITGAASGIGEALAHALAARGAQLLLADVDAARLGAVRDAVAATGAACEALPTDVARPQALAALAGRAQALWGGADVLVNNAGVALVAPVQTLEEADARWLVDINFWGVVNGCRLFLPQLRSRPRATIVNLSSVYAMLSPPTQSIYCATKAAVRAFSDALREELRGTGVTVLCVHPGGVRTRIVRSARKPDVTLVADSPQALDMQFEQVARTTPEAAAGAIVAAIAQGRTRLLVGADARVGDWLFRLAPGRASAWVTALARRRREAGRKRATP